MTCALSRIAESDDIKAEVKSRLALHRLAIMGKDGVNPSEKSLEFSIDIFCSEPTMAGEYYIVCGFREYSGVASVSFIPYINDTPYNKSPCQCNFGPGGWLLQQMQSDNMIAVRKEIESHSNYDAKPGAGFVARDYTLLFRK